MAHVIKVADNGCSQGYAPACILYCLQLPESHPDEYLYYIKHKMHAHVLIDVCSEDEQHLKPDRNYAHKLH